jgi:hypothetical protein
MVAVAVLGLLVWLYPAWAEWSLQNGFYSSRLSQGQVIRTGPAVQAAPATEDEGGLKVVGVESWSLPAGTACLVLNDYAVDEDDCHSDRNIRVRILEGPHEGGLALIQRIFLRK